MTGTTITVTPSLNPGPKNSITDPQTGLRFYRWQGKDYPSVTTIRRMAGVTMPLHWWSINQVVDRAVDQLSELNRKVSTDDPAQAALAKTWLRKAVTDKRDVAADLGIRVHRAASEGLGFDQVAADVIPFLKQYLDWLAQSGVTILCVEKQVYNITIGYAGSFDILVEFPSGRRFIVDIKTGKGIYSDHALQAIAYGMAEFVGEDDKVLQQETDWMNSVDGMAILHVRPTGWSWNVINPDHDMAEAFVGLLHFATWTHTNYDIANLISLHEEGKAP